MPSFAVATSQESANSRNFYCTQVEVVARWPCSDERIPFMKITGLNLRELTGTLEHEGEFWEERLIRPIDVYPEHKAQGPYATNWHPYKIDEGRYKIQLVFPEIETDEGVSGLAGPVDHNTAI